MSPWMPFIAALVASLLAAPLHAQNTANAPAAAAWQPVQHQAGSGMAWVRRGTGERSARQLSQQSLQALGGRMDRQPRSLGGMVSREDNAAMASFVGHLRGKLVQGYVLAQTSPQGYTVVVAMDEPSQLARSAPLMLSAADAAGAGAAPASASPYRNLNWGRVSFGTGQLELPQGWQVVGAHQGAVDVVGPQGEVVSLGAALQIATPEAARQFAATGLPLQMMVAPVPQDPVAAFRSVRPQLERFLMQQGAPVVRLTQVRESERVPLGQFTAGLIASDGVGSQGNRPYRKLSLVAFGGMMANGNWLLYQSEVYAPSELYPHALPVMLRIWNSWNVDKSVLMERVVAAAQSMRETNDIIKGMHDNRQQSQDRLSQAWGHHLRGTVVVADSDTGRQSTEWLYQPGPAAGGVGTEHNRHMAQVLRDANQAAGYERWQIVPP